MSIWLASSIIMSTEQKKRRKLMHKDIRSRSTALESHRERANSWSPNMSQEQVKKVNSLSQKGEGFQNKA